MSVDQWGNEELALVVVPATHRPGFRERNYREALESLTLEEATVEFEPGLSTPSANPKVRLTDRGDARVWRRRPWGAAFVRTVVPAP